MNRVILMGRPTKDPSISYNGDKCYARYSLAVDRVGEGTDFINCVSFGKTAEFVEKYLTKGIKIAAEGAIRTGSYTKDGVKTYTTDVIVDRLEFCEKKGDTNPLDNPLLNEVMEVEDEELPFV